MRRKIKRNAYFDSETKCEINLAHYIDKALNYH